VSWKKRDAVMPLLIIGKLCQVNSGLPARWQARGKIAYNGRNFKYFIISVLSIKSGTQFYVLTALAAVAILLLLTVPDENPELQQVIVPVVQVATVGLRDLVPVETVSGRLEPARKTSLHFELAGQLHARPVEPGQSVQAGEALLMLDSGDYEDALAEAEAQLAQETLNIERDRELLKLSRSNYALQKNDLDRLLKLGEDSLVSKSRLDETRIKLIQLESEVAQLRSSVASAESRLALKEAARNRAARNLERTQLPAPFAGTVNAVNVQVGDYVTPGHAVVDLVDAASLDLYAEVRGDIAQSLAQGQVVTVEVNGAQVPGEVIALQIDPNPETFTHALRVRITGDQARPGQVARVRLPLREMLGVTAVPSTAVLFDEGRASVFRLEGNTLQQVDVKPGERVDGLQIILQGLAASDRVVTRDVSALSHGQQVQAIDATTE
jgi:RND family efflux transporter MFP subunit